MNWGAWMGGSANSEVRRFMFEIADTIDRWLGEQQSIALATVVETWGSAPRQVGAKMAITDTMAIIGSVSGGCVESAVVQEALDSLADRKPRLLHFGVSNDTAWEVGLTCGGTIRVYVEPLDKAWWAQASSLIHQHKAAATITVLDGDLAGEKLLVDVESKILYATQRADRLLPATVQALQTGRSGRQRFADFDVLVDVQRPQPRLIIIGAVHVAMALHQFAQQLGFRVIVIDPRAAFATPERFPKVDLMLHSYPDKALPQAGIDADTYIAVLTHDPKIDDPALQIALTSSTPYIGVLSSKRAHEQRVQRLIEKGVDPALLTRIHTPIGLPIAAQTPEEIALCIMAEIVAVRNRAAVRHGSTHTNEAIVL
jgi:xanthine dehydrogenase accessory factor